MWFEHNLIRVYIQTGTKSSAAEIVHHYLYEESAYSARAHVGNDLTLIRLDKATTNNPICLPKTTDTPIGKENNLVYTMGLGQRQSELPAAPITTTKKAVKIDKYATQANFKCVSSSRNVSKGLRNLKENRL